MMALVFTGDEFGDGLFPVLQTLRDEKVKASFFFTGRFYKDPGFAKGIRELHHDGHYLGAHSDRHLLYCDWQQRDSLLVSRKSFARDLRRNYKKMQRFYVSPREARYFLPPYEWYNDSIAAWTRGLGHQLINYTPGTLSPADYTTPEMTNYRDNQTILASIKGYEAGHAAGLNGFILLVHVGADPARTEKLYQQLPELIRFLKKKGYQPVRIDRLLGQ